MRFRAVFLLAAASSLWAAVDPDLAGRAEKELFAARSKSAAELYSKLLREDPTWAPGYYGLVRALIDDHRASEAYTAGEEALRRVPDTAEGQTAGGLALYRRGEFSKAEACFRKALQIKPNYPAALVGMASIYQTISKFQTEQSHLTLASHFAPDDPELIVANANTRKGAEHLAALERALAIYDPESRQAKSLRAHVAADRALGERELRRLSSPYRRYELKLVPVMSGPDHKFGVGLNVRLNGRQTVHLMLDTGASGISISAKSADKAGLEILGGEKGEARGVGDDKPRDSFRYLAAEIAIADLAFTNVPVSVFRSAKTDAHDGLIGADVFRQFLVTLDFPGSNLTLDPFPAGLPPDDPDDSGTPPSGFVRAFRFHNHLTVSTAVNEQPARLFLIDSGASVNMIDTALAKEFTGVHRDSRAALQGVQGRVKDVGRADRVTLSFAGFRQRNLGLLSMDMEKLSDSFGASISGILGMPLLWNMKLTIDYGNGAVRFEYVPDRRGR